MHQVSLRLTVSSHGCVEVHRLVLFFHDVYCFFDSPLVVAFSVDHLGVVPVCDVVERDGVVCDCCLVLLSCGGYTGAGIIPFLALPWSSPSITTMTLC